MIENIKKPFVTDHAVARFVSRVVYPYQDVLGGQFDTRDKIIDYIKNELYERSINEGIPLGPGRYLIQRPIVAYPSIPSIVVVVDEKRHMIVTLWILRGGCQT